LILNRPGLSALQYRIGVFASFRQAMADAISRDRRLDALTTREADDMAMSILESFAAIGDVLSFYNERLVNELFLRTALERDSVRRLIYLTGYRLRPGLAATTDLAFQLDDGANLTLRRGLKTMSVPGPEEDPVFFETLADLEADAGLNKREVFALPQLFNGFARGRSEGPVTRLPEDLKPGDRLLIWGLERVEEKASGTAENARDGQRLHFTPPIQGIGLWPEVANASRATRRLRIFGHDAPDQYSLYVADTTISPADRWQTLPLPHQLAEGLPLPLDRTYDDLSPGDRLLIDGGPGSVPRLRSVRVSTVEDVSQTLAAAGDSVGFRTETVTRVEVRQTLRGQPGSSGHFHTARTEAGNLVRMNRVAGESSWTMMELAVSADPSVVEQSGVQHVVSRASGGALLHYTVAADGTTVGTNRGGFLTTQPVLVALSTGEVSVFARGLDGALWSMQLEPAVGTWTRVGGLLASAPALVETTAGTLNVFVRGLDRGLWRRVRSGGAWSDWERLRGTLATAPVCAVDAAGNLDVVALDDKGRLIHRREDSSGWREWTTRDGRLEGAPALVPGPNRLDVLATGQDGALWHLARVGDDWGIWRSLGGALASPPSARRSGTRIDVVSRGADDTLWERTWQGGSWGPWFVLGNGMPAINDRRRARIWQISPDDVIFRDFDYADQAEGGALAMPLAAGEDPERLTGLLRKRRAIVASDGQPHATEITEAQAFATDLGMPADHLRLGLRDPLPADTLNPRLMANVARASHGETQRPEPLPGPTGPVALRTARMKGSPLTYIADGKVIAGQPELDLRVGGVRWLPVESLYGQDPKARVFTLRETSEGESEIAFGDGRHGAIPQGAPNAIQGVYRVGTGNAGRVRAGQLSVLLEKPPGLSSVTNPAAASGAADPEPRDQGRENAPAKLRAFERIVSLEDFVAVAKATGLVAKAHVTWVWQAFERAAHLSVAGPGGAALTSDDLALLHQMLDNARLPYRRLTIAGLTMIPMVVTARIVPAEDTSKDDAAASARAALGAFFDFDTRAVGQAVHASSIYAALHDAPGVAAADVDVFNVKGFRDFTAADLAKRALTAEDLQPQVRVYPARPLPADPTEVDPLAKAPFDGPLPPVLPAEQAFIETASEDVNILVTEAL
jgi:hypothetical protein